MYKVFKESKPLFLHDDPCFTCDLKNVIYLKLEDFSEFKDFETFFWDSPHLNGMSCFAPDLKKAWKKLKSHYKLVKAAGGIVSDNHGRTLIIERNNYWDLPKGHKKKNESIEDAALREVQEECSITSHYISNPKTLNQLPRLYPGKKTNFKKNLLV